MPIRLCSNRIVCGTFILYLSARCGHETGYCEQAKDHSLELKRLDSTIQHDGIFGELFKTTVLNVIADSYTGIMC